MSLRAYLRSFRDLFKHKSKTCVGRPRLTLETLESRDLPSFSWLALDCGPVNSPIQPGFTRLGTAAYSASAGYGWESPAGISLIDRAAPSAMRRDFAQAKNETLLVDVVNGVYKVNLYFGDAAAARPAVRIYAEGINIGNSAATAAGQFITKSFNVTVNDGTLNLNLISKNGSATFALNAVKISAKLLVDVGPDLDVDEGQSFQFNATTSAASPYLTAWDFGDGTTAGGSLQPAKIYADQGFYSALLTVTSSTGIQYRDLALVSVRNVAPTAVFSSGGSVVLGNAGSVSFANASDPSAADTAAGFLYSYDFDSDGTFEIVDGSAASASVPASYLTTTGVHTVAGRIADKDGGFTSYTTSVNVVSSLPSASFSNGGAVNEGSSGSVSFSNVAGGAGGYTYSYDFDNNGTFEVAGSANASATVPASYLDDGPGSRVVHGRVTDSAGAFVDYTTSITINNVAPSVTLAATFSGTTGSGVTFSATVSDPSSADTNAGLTYLWNFGDGATSAEVHPTHSYALVGAYTLSLTVKDKDNGSTTKTSQVAISQPAPIGDYIITPYDKIPNFGAHPTVVSVVSGNWSDPATWSTGQIPAAGDIVSIVDRTTVTYDVVSDSAVNTVAIQAGGHLSFRTDINTRLTVINFLVIQDGELQIGTEANPVAAGVKAEVVFANVPIDTNADPAQYGHGLIGLGKVTMHGAVMSDTFIRLAVEPKVGNTTLTLSSPAAGWKAGDRIVLPDTRQLLDGQRWSSYVPQWEALTIQSISADGLTVTLTSALQFDHIGARNAAGVLEFLPHVANLTRNVVVRSQSASGTRGYTMFTGRADVDIRYTQFSGLGRTTKSAIDDTTWDANGNVTHVGTNESGRYSVYFRHLIGPVIAPVNGHQFTFSGNSVFCPLNPMPFRWGISLLDSHYGLISDNVLYNWAGAGIMTESGSESYNLFDHNIVVATRGDNNPRSANPVNFGLEGTAFWMLGFNNYFRNNVATDAICSQQEIVTGAGFKFYWYAGSIANTPIPLFPGADLSVSGQFQLVDMQLTPIPEFSGNEAYGAMAAGMTIWHLGTDGYVSRPMAQTVIKDFTTWNPWEEGFFAYPINNVLFDGYVVRGSALNASSNFSRATGWRSGDYWAQDVTIRRADIQVMYSGVSGSINTPGTFRIEDSYFRNAGVNISVQNLATPGTRAVAQTRRTIIDNVRFDPYPGAPAFRTIEMTYSPSASGGNNYIQKDEVFVYNYNGVAGDNFQLYYLQQRPDFILPQTTYYGPDNNGDGVPDYVDNVGSPEAGLTNQQNWDKYGIAFAGGIAPTTQTRDNVLGLVRPI